jgi:pyroglutamyl-peptidase
MSHTHAFLAVAALCSVLAAAPQTTRAAEIPELPVILLTGFEPFGPQKPPNPSWEGVKQLDGREWRGHKLVARQITVVWGAPLKQLQQLIAEHRPAAIFAFGQGGGYALETRARNARGSIPDNNGAMPPSPTVIADGPTEFRSSLESKAMLAALQAKGYDARLSTDAGSYLCEEMLYTLEWLKRAGKVPGAVSFCHVPSLGADSPAGPVTAKHIQRFVEDYLDAWQAAPKPLAVRGQSPDHQTTKDAGADPQQQEVHDFIDRYFRSWSNQDMERYGQCFMPQAAVQLIDEHGRLITMPLGPFLRSQQESHRRAANRMIETPEKVSIRFDARLAHALVYWKLVDGNRIEYGYDHFTLMRHEGKWRIANLIFYSTPLEDNTKEE